MSKLSEFVKRFRKPRPAPPVIMSEWGPVTESARLQAAINMRLDAELRKKVEAVVIQEVGDTVLGLKECMRRYPEAYAKE